MKMICLILGQFRWSRVFSLLALTAVLGLCGCAVHPARMPWQFYNDTALTRKVNDALEASHVSTANMHVSTFDYTVRLAGYVNTPADKEQAVLVTRRVPGVREVLDYVQVGTPQPPQGKAERNSPQ